MVVCVIVLLSAGSGDLYRQPSKIHRAQLKNPGADNEKLVYV
jgi:hypothetical protein